MLNRGAERLAEYCKKHYDNQYELAELLELAEAHLSQLLSGKRRPGLPIAVRIEERTGVPAESWLLKPVGKSAKAKRDTPGSDEISQRESSCDR